MDQWEDQLKRMAGVATAAMAIWAVIKLVFQPLVKRIKRYRQEHPHFRRTVMQALRELQDGQKRFDDYNAAILRERIESAYTLYVLMMGWCPTGEKKMLAELFELLKQTDWDYMGEKYRAEIMALPVSPPEQREKEYKK